MAGLQEGQKLCGPDMYDYIVRLRVTKFGMVTHVGMSIVLGSITPRNPRRAKHVRCSKILGPIVSGVYPYLQMAQLSHGQIWGGGRKTLE